MARITEAAIAVLALAACGRRAPARDAAPVSAPATHRPIATSSAPPTRAAPVTASIDDTCPVERTSLAPGLTVERWPIPATPIAGGPACIDVVRADPARFTVRALSATEPRTALEWRDTEHLAAVINAGMFHATGAPVGLIVASGTARGTDNRKMSGFLAWDPISPTDPAVTITGRTCADFDLAALRRRYRSLVQSYRLLGCTGDALAWQDPKRYSAAAIGVDRTGHLVLLHARAAVTMAELSTALAAHDLAGALFLEGGPEASLVARGPDGDLARVGSYETGFVENDDNDAFWKLPNVIALLPR